MKKAVVYYILYIAFLMLVAAGVLTVGAYQTAKYEIKSYMVSQGDTYDLLAEKFKVEEDRRTWRERVKRLNGRSDSWLYEGETIFIFIESE